MYQCSTFSQVIKLIDRELVKEITEKHKSDKSSKGFGTWQHLVALLFSQLSGCRSIRELEVKFNAKPQIHYHCRAVPLKKSTLSDANKKRSNEVYRDIALGLLQRSQRTDKGIGKLINLFDATTITISGRGSEWAEGSKTRMGQGLKVHLSYKPDDDMMDDFKITATNVNDITAAQSFGLSSERIYIFDKGYYDFNWWLKIIESGSDFITRIKSNTKYRIIRDNSIDTKEEPYVLLDQVIELTNKHPRGGKTNQLVNRPLRLVKVINPQDNKNYTFISNLLSEKASVIASYYKRRWAIELLFKWLKQNLKLSKFLSENENGIKTQIYIAMILHLLLNVFKCMHHNSFSRTIDLLSWLRIAIISHDIRIIPPNITKNHKLKQMSWSFI